jgi:hypothetical protein
LVVSFNNTLSVFSTRYLIINRCDLIILSFLSSPISVSNKTLFFLRIFTHLSMYAFFVFYQHTVVNLNSDSMKWITTPIYTLLQ